MKSDKSTSYRLSFPDHLGHLVDVEMRVADPGETLELWMPVWTPGSYLVREYSRNVQEFRAAGDGGAPLDWTKTKKNRWQVTTGGASEAVIRYRVYGREKSVRSNWIDDLYAIINGAATYLVVEGRESSPHHIAVEPPEGWSRVLTSLAADTDKAHNFTAANLDELVDSPLVLGNPATYDFTVDDCRFTLVNEGEGGLWDGKRAVADVETIVRTYRDLYGGLPIDRYCFYNLIVEAGGGLEHKNSCVLMTSRYAYRERKAYVAWLGLVSHEFLHVWNVKRSRPIELGPFDYENEVYTRSLWVAEGFTVYYTDLTPCRAALTTEAEYLEILSRNLAKLHAIPGRHLHSLEDSSFDAWIKLYRPDENSLNTTVSYYLKGGIVGWLLDVEIRRISEGNRSLDHVMRLLFERYSGDTGFTPEDVQAAAEAVAGASLQAFFDHAIRSTRELDFAPALELLGLRFKKNTETDGCWLGIETEEKNGRLLVKNVRSDGPANAAGINAEDELIALGGYRVTPDTLASRLAQYPPDEELEVLISRFGDIQVIPVTPVRPPGNPWQLELDPDAGPEAVAERNRWLHSE